AADDAHRRAFGEYADRAEKAGGDADLRAVGDHRLLGLAAAIGIENVQREVVALEHAGLVADLGDEGFANAAAAHRDLERVRPALPGTNAAKLATPESDETAKLVRRMYPPERAPLAARANIRCIAGAMHEDIAFPRD